MKCEDIQNLISVAGDDLLDDNERDMLDRHLSTCPLCRQERDDIRNLTRELRMMRRPAISANALYSVRTAVSDSASSRVRSFWLAEDLRPWSTWIMPSGVGTLASIVIGFAFLWTLFMIPIEKRAAMPNTMSDPQLAILRRASDASRSYASKRKDVSNESPSINPEGTLVALTNSLVRGDMKDSEVVVVADVFGSGLAQIDEVVEPSRDRHAVDELDRALRSDPAFAPFVPASVDKRPDSVKVIFKIQNVRVNTRIKGDRQ